MGCKVKTLTRRFKSYRKRTSDYQITRAYRLAWATVLIHHIIVMLAGCVGFIVAPSPTVAKIVGGEIATYLWSGTFIIFGFFGLVSRLMHRARAEGVSVASIAAARILWAGILLYSIVINYTDIGTLQLVLMLLAGAVFLIGWSLTVFVWMSGAPLATPTVNTEIITQLRDQLQEVVDRPRDQE